jgi:hypothetical protein
VTRKLKVGMAVAVGLAVLVGLAEGARVGEAVGDGAAGADGLAEGALGLAAGAGWQAERRSRLSSSAKRGRLMDELCPKKD